MKSSSLRLLLTKARRLTSLQTDTMSPRGATRSHTTLSLSNILHHNHHHHHRHSSSSLNVPIATAPPYSSSSSSSSSSFNTHTSTISSSHFNMDSKHPHHDDTETAIKDQGREGYCKESCDDYNMNDPSKGRLSDYLLPHILNLYASRATPQDFEIYAPHATFEDPLMCAHGIKQIKSAFYSVSKAFGESRITEYSIHENVISAGKMEILIDNKQYYKFMGKDINLVSLIKLYTEDGKIVRHEDLWDKKPLWNKETVKAPLIGHIIDATKRASMFATHALMRFGKDPTM